MFVIQESLDNLPVSVVITCLDCGIAYQVSVDNALHCTKMHQFVECSNCGHTAVLTLDVMYKSSSALAHGSETWTRL